jgi:type II secretory pathway pseudopilin PulG
MALPVKWKADRKNMAKQTGQTLIETVVALFIMVMGITAALGLANYSFSASSNVRKQIIGVGLAREGIEAVKNMRDTNWLNGSIQTNCYNFADSGSLSASCYKDWLNPASGGYNLNFNGSLYLYFNAAASSGNGYWLYSTSASNAWGLNTSTDINNGLYTPSAGATGSSGFYRQIVITPDTTAPFDAQSSGNPYFQRLLVRSRVWWTDKNCPATSTWPNGGKCSLELQTYLTNWKTF